MRQVRRVPQPPIRDLTIFSCLDSITSFTITFNKGGATDFARAFFRLTEGNLFMVLHIACTQFINTMTMSARCCRSTGYEHNTKRTNSTKRRKKEEIEIAKFIIYVRRFYSIS